MAQCVSVLAAKPKPEFETQDPHAGGRNGHLQLFSDLTCTPMHILNKHNFLNFKGIPVPAIHSSCSKYSFSGGQGAAVYSPLSCCISSAGITVASDALAASFLDVNITLSCLSSVSCSINKASSGGFWGILHKPLPVASNGSKTLPSKLQVHYRAERL